MSETAANGNGNNLPAVQNQWTGDTFSLAPRTIEEALKFSELIAKSSMVPPQFKDKPADVLVAVQMGMEVGLKPLQAIQNIAVINGRPCIWGDAILAVIQASKLLEDFKETDDGNTATCYMKRFGIPNPVVQTFSMEDAKRANLAGKAGPWTQFPQRMRQLRARAFAARNLFADVLKGLSVAEEVQDYPVRDVTPRNGNGYTEPAATTIQTPQRKSEAKPVETPKEVAAEVVKPTTAESVIENVTVNKKNGTYHVLIGGVDYTTKDEQMATLAKNNKGRAVSPAYEMEGSTRVLVELHAVEEATVNPS